MRIADPGNVSKYLTANKALRRAQRLYKVFACFEAETLREVLRRSNEGVSFCSVEKK